MSTEQTAIPAPPEEPYTPLADDEWEEDREALPRRPRRRLLGAGGNPVQVALLGVLLLACGFIGGVLVEKGQTSSTTSGAGGALASRFAALRGGGTTGGGTTGSGSAAGGSAASGSAGGGASAGGGGFAGRFGGTGGGAMIGEVSYISGGTLYVTDAEGNTVKVMTSPASSITKTVKTDVHGIRPGETVIVRGVKGATGSVSAESVSVSTGGVGGGLGALFGGGASGTGAARSGAGGGATGGEPTLFGK